MRAESEDRLPEARENAGDQVAIGFSLESDWLIEWGWEIRAILEYFRHWMENCSLPVKNLYRYVILRFLLSFYQVIKWIEEHGETFLSKHTGVGKSLVKAEALLKRHDEFESIAQVRNVVFCKEMFMWTSLYISMNNNPWKYCSVAFIWTVIACEQALILNASARCFYARRKVMRPLATRASERFASGLALIISARSR